MRRRPMDGLDEEIRGHLDEEAADYIARGLSPDEARRRARLAFGSVALAMEDSRAVWTSIRLEHLIGDARHALRSLRKTPGLSAVALLSLAAALGLATAAFSVIHGAFLSSLPVAHADRLVVVQEYHRSGGYNVALTPEQVALRRERSRSFEALGFWYSRNATLGRPGGDAPPGLVRAEYVSANSLAMLGVAPALGRHPVEADAAPGTDPVAVLGDGVWRSRFGADPDILERFVSIDGVPHRVIGVMPPRFAFPIRGDLWVPVRTDGAGRPAAAQRLTLFGILRDGVSAREAQAELAVLAASGQGRDDGGATAPLVMPFARGFMSPEQEWALYAFLLGLLLFVVLIAANLANLFFARHSARAREIAVRSALGASRGRLIVQLLLESLLLASGGALLGLAVSRAGVAWFQSRVEDVPWWADFHVDLTVLAALAVAALAATAVAGVGPALRLTRQAAAAPLREGTLASGLRFSRLGASMIAVQLATSVAFLGVVGVLAQGLFGFGYQRYQLPGRDVVVAQLYLGGPDEAELARPGADRRDVWRRHSERSRAELDRITARLRELPGVRQVAMATLFPGNDVESALIELDADAGRERVVSTRIAEIGPGFFETLGVGVARGRGFTAAEHSGPSRAVIVNEPFVRKHFPAQDPVGRSLRLSGGSPEEAGPWLEIVGVVPDLGMNPGDAGRADGIYVPFGPSSFARLAVRSAVEPGDLVPRILEIALRESPNAQLQSAQTLEAQMNAAEAVFRGLASGLSIIGGTALLLSAVSFYSLVSFGVTRRTREIGIRVALGATRGRILRNVLGRELAVVLWGAGLGILLGLGLYRLVDLIPFDLSPAGPSFLAVVAGLMLFVGAGACLRPLLQAMAIDPADALRQQT